MSTSMANTEAPRKHRPYVPESMEMKEFTFRAVLIGLFLTALLGSANAYLGLKAGMTIAATYPAAVISHGAVAVDEGFAAGREHRANRGLDRRVGSGGRHIHHSCLCDGWLVADT